VLAAKAIGAAPQADGRLAYAFRQVLARPPAPAELTILRRMLDRQHKIYDADAAAAAAVTAVGEAPKATNVDATDHAALSAVCLAILNLDEALSHE